MADNEQANQRTQGGRDILQGDIVSDDVQLFELVVPYSPVRIPDSVATFNDPLDLITMSDGPAEAAGIPQDELSLSDAVNKLGLAASTAGRRVTGAIGPVLPKVLLSTMLAVSPGVVAPVTTEPAGTFPRPRVEDTNSSGK